jgi:hypothetical protein
LIPLNKLKKVIKMLTNYIKKLGISSPKAVVYLNQERHAFGCAINGHLEIQGGLLKNVLKRYEIDLVREEQDQLTEEVLNTRSVYCSRECLRNKKEILPFILNVPENDRENSERYTYSLVVRVILENSQTVLKKHPLNIQNM